MSKSVMDALRKCPHCGQYFLPGMEGKPDGSACFECETPLPEEPRVHNWKDPHHDVGTSPE